MIRRGWKWLAPIFGLCLLGPLAAQDDPQLEVSESGVGTAVVDRQLKGKAESFPESSRVYFWTRVVGGREGDRIRHVWIHGDQEVSIGLSIGGPHWRTHSAKWLHPGSAGKWIVEARDSADRVLARQEFSCQPSDEPPQADR